MQKSKRIFLIADFKDESPRAVFLEERRLVKGLIRCGHDVQRFAYRNVMAQFNPFSGEHFRRFIPVLCHYLERFDKDKKFTVGYFVEASRKKE
jgi:hypothetical protein